MLALHCLYLSYASSLEVTEPTIRKLECAAFSNKSSMRKVLQLAEISLWQQVPTKTLLWYFAVRHYKNQLWIDWFTWRIFLSIPINLAVVSESFRSMACTKLEIPRYNVIATTYAAKYVYLDESNYSFCLTFYTLGALCISDKIPSPSHLSINNYHFSAYE